MTQEFFSGQEAPISERSKQESRRESIIMRAREDAAQFMEQLHTDLGGKRILPGTFNLLDENNEKLMRRFMEKTINAQSSSYSSEEMELYIDEFYKECYLGYPKEVH